MYQFDFEFGSALTHNYDHYLNFACCIEHDIEHHPNVKQNNMKHCWLNRFKAACDVIQQIGLFLDKPYFMWYILLVHFVELSQCFQQIKLEVLNYFWWKPNILCTKIRKNRYLSGISRGLVAKALIKGQAPLRPASP